MLALPTHLFVYRKGERETKNLHETFTVRLHSYICRHISFGNDSFFAGRVHANLRPNTPQHAHDTRVSARTSAGVSSVW